MLNVDGVCSNHRERGVIPLVDLVRHSLSQVETESPNLGDWVGSEQRLKMTTLIWDQHTSLSLAVNFSKYFLSLSSLFHLANLP